MVKDKTSFVTAKNVNQPPITVRTQTSLAKSQLYSFFTTLRSKNILGIQSFMQKQSNPREHRMVYTMPAGAHIVYSDY